MADKLGDRGDTGAEGGPVPETLPGEAAGGGNAELGAMSERATGRIRANAAYFEEQRGRIQAVVGPYRIYKSGEETIEQLMGGR